MRQTMLRQAAVGNPALTPLPKQTSATPAKTLDELISLFSEDTGTDQFDVIVHNLSTDSDFNTHLAELHNKPNTTNPASFFIKQYFIDKHDMGETILKYVDYGYDAYGHQIDTKPNGLISSVRNAPNGGDRDATITDYMIKHGGQGGIATMRSAALDKRASNLKYDKDTLNDPTKIERLVIAYKNFHTDHSQKKQLPDYVTRLGDYYYQVATILDDTFAAQDFICANFDLLVQPPKVILPTHHLSPDNMQISVAIKKAAGNLTNDHTIEAYSDMAGRFEKNGPVNLRSRNSMATKPAPVAPKATEKLVTPPQQSDKDPATISTAAVTTAATQGFTNNKTDILIDSAEEAQQLDNLIGALGGPDQAMAVLQRMQREGLNLSQLRQADEFNAAYNNLMTLYQRLDEPTLKSIHQTHSFVLGQTA